MSVDLIEVKDSAEAWLRQTSNPLLRRVFEDTIQLVEEVGLQKEYIEFLVKASKGPESIAEVHGYEMSREDFEEGERLRAKIAALDGRGGESDGR